MSDPRPAHRASALTVKATGRRNRIISGVKVCAAFDPQKPPDDLPPYIETKALWDTGATNSGIAINLAEELNLPPVSQVTVHHGDGSSDRLCYLVNFTLLPNNVSMIGALVSGLPLSPSLGFRVILGMDVIGFGDFAITNLNGRTWMSFRTPSSDHIDYVHEINRANFAGVRPNDLCPCGSGKKFKKCHRLELDAARG